MSAESHLGKQHSSKPVTDSDKIMSKRHIAHRKIIESMKDTKEKLIKSMAYNKAHRDEHDKAMEKAKKKLVKAGVKIAKTGEVIGKRMI